MAHDSPRDGERTPDRVRRLNRVREARARLASPGSDSRERGRAWINGREVGGADGRFAHLAHSHD
jgi:hypothetical protein